MGNDNGLRETPIGPLPEAWDAVELGALGTRFHGGGTPSTKKPEYWNGEIAWTTSAYIGDELYLEQCAGYITPLGLKNSSSQLVPRGNLLIGTRVGVGKVAINQFDTAISQDLTGMHVNRNKVDAAFLAYALRTDFCQERFLSASRGTTIKGIPRADLVEISVPLPPLAEQRRIAAVLNAIQDAIAAQEDVIAAARAFKRSLMHRLFTYGPGPVPAATKETEIGEIPAHWEIRTLGELTQLQRGKFAHRPRNDPAYFGGHVPFIQTGDVANSSERVASYSQTLNDLGLSVSRIFPRGTMVMTIAGANVGDVGILDFDSAFPDSLVAITAFDGVDTEYLKCYFQTQKERIGTLASFGVQKNINLQLLSSWLTPKPPYCEQRAIVESADSVDAKIAAEEDRKTALEALFKSMLHELMTGRLRLLSDDGLPALAARLRAAE